MLGQRDPQATIFDGDQLYLEHVGERTLYGYLARHRHELFRDADFAELYDAKLGRPSVPPSLLCLALLLQTYERCSDAEARDRAAYDQRWKVALGAADREKPFTKSTLQLFRAHLLLHEKARLPFERSLAMAKKSGYLRSHGRLRAVIDSTNILGRGAVRDTYNLIGDGIVSVARILGKLSGTRLEEWAAEHDLGRYVGSSLKGEAKLDWSSEAEKEAFLAGLVTDAERVLELADRAEKGLAADDVRREQLRRAAEILRQVLLQDVEKKSDGEGGGQRLRQGTSAERICSVHDPEMRHGRKSASVRFDGHKAQVVADVETGLVAAVDVIEGSAKDEEGSLELVQEAGATTGLKVEEALADCAYGSGENRERFEVAGINLLAKVPKQPRSDFFTKDQFEIDLEAITCRCPAGQVTARLVSDGRQTTATGAVVRLQAFSFPRGVCAECPLRDRCYRKRTHGRRVRLHPQEAKLQAARSWQHSPAFDDFRKQRQVVEHRIARLVQLGIRQARYFGRRKTLFQLFLAATVANLTLVAGHQLPKPAAAGLLQLVRAAFQHLRQPFRAFTTAAQRLATAAMLIGAWSPALPRPLAQMAIFRPSL
ncbi:MAG TPA: IS1182 family transposase [Myxococcaceae bacterium]|jgi:hypothetical protein|nr:IS1182 family transposase [Myxococcaceae bacterium]